MYGYENYDCEEPSDEELDEMEAERDTEVKIVNDSLEIKFNTENFARGIIEAVKAEIKGSLRSDIVADIKRDCLQDVKEKIQLSVHEIVKDIIVDFMKNEKVQVGGNSIWDDEPREELTLMQYSKRCIKSCIENGKFKIIKGMEKDRYSGDYRAKTEDWEFSAYIQSHLGIDSEVKSYIDEQVDAIRKQVNKDVKTVFDESTKNMLSQTVLNVLMANDTYKKIEDNISCIADKTKQ